MLSSLTGLTGSVLSSALDGLSARQNAIAHNIANLDTPGFQAESVSFEDSLAGAYSSAAAQSADVVGTVVLSSQTTQTPTGANGNNVDLRKEALASVQTQIAYQLTARAMSDQFTLLKMAAG